MTSDPSHLASLQQALILPGAELRAEPLTDEQLTLWLLSLPDPRLTLDSQAIGAFWQRLPYWAFAWAGGRALARWIVDNPNYVAGKRVLDFGCGSALVGIAAAKAGAAEVWIADLDNNALLAATENAALNDVHVLPVQGEWPQVDLLLASDVLYDISSSADLKQLMLNIPDWILAESHFVAPDFVALDCLHSTVCSTLPAIGDFDEAVAIEIYCRAGQTRLT
ncbi:MAG: 50S ribosomal protein L11 methyltransferase [Saccharospirillaceae bacterium]|nr:50S ribosomal protein L11 methyltransferase [Saccharospirillaceae bacterium]MCD8530430.1 50S ribosomal protein L11 methyltransferase [Saccharospirillaceae bacterium]